MVALANSHGVARRPAAVGPVMMFNIRATSATGRFDKTNTGASV
jgi:hypothetical protein